MCIIPPKKVNMKAQFYQSYINLLQTILNKKMGFQNGYLIFLQYMEGIILKLHNYYIKDT